MTILATFAIDSCAAANGTLAQLRKSMAIELAPKNLQLNAVGAEWVITDSTIGLKSSLFYKLLARIPVRRFGTAAELACAAVMLTSHPCGFVTEASLSADGGCAIG